MIYRLFLLACLFQLNYCDWISEWVLPMQNQLKENAGLKQSAFEEMDIDYGDVNKKMSGSAVNGDQATSDDRTRTIMSPAAVLKEKLERSLDTAENLVETLKGQIIELTMKENVLKDAIANGRSGVTAVTVSTVNQPPRTYIIREGVWSLCNGIVQLPAASKSAVMYRRRITTPRCIGQEVVSKRDPCVYNSLIKYETIPARRRMEYTEDDVLCLKTSFNVTMEQYMSVPKRIIDETCKRGVVRTLEGNIKSCGIRTMSDYTYYPHKRSSALLPLEYCSESDGSCKLIVAWHVSENTIENFEFLKNEQGFKQYFMKVGPNAYVEQAM